MPKLISISRKIKKNISFKESNWRRWGSWRSRTPSFLGMAKSKKL